jgi:putative endonuclease
MHVKEAFAKAAGEYAASYLKGCGFKILDRDWQCDGQIIPIVAAERGTLVIIDLRVRAGTRHGTPLEDLAPARRRLLRTLGARWLDGHGMRFDRIRVDVAGLLQEDGGFTIEHIRAVG